ncbi:hypothetical protein ACFOUP_18380 [Belliella kenyensis]|uniref:Uncharacterized protein n=1 Tax=Belliella kenyensis TaxID=1472724 RepID=A0ABV8ERK5_9BACT|nr:hypothetical protein [Belliella kenyensis]MCH7402254.1 hypothetical protein [Belliella kenyensis]MDN3601768.1 hypothetical protein [Belliella kenyensis]
MNNDNIQSIQGKILGIYSKLQKDESIQLSHMAICMALIGEFIKNQGRNRFRITRKMIMKNSQVKSLSTYHRCMKDLVRKNIIIYSPSYHPKLGSVVRFV